MPSRLDLSGVPECTSCGACCFGDGPEYLRVAGADYERLGDDAPALTEFLGDRAFMRMVDGHCIALRREPGTGRFWCSVYDKRPDVCHWLERGSGQCRAKRHEKRERTLVQLSRAPSQPRQPS
jgi:hypothetical protein